MSKNWVKDIHDMQTKYGTRAWMETATQEQKKRYLEFRIDFLREELDETETALINMDAEEIVDGLIDLCVVAIGTLDAIGVDPTEEWNKVIKANMNKHVGVKPERPNKKGLPDLMKPDNWEAPNHNGNHGKLNDI